MRTAFRAAFAGFFALCATAAQAAPPHYDHVVIVIEENHSFSQIVGNLASAPYINQLANGGVSFTNFFGVTHPSQPNYLEFFSGSGQDVADDALPLNYPYSTPNLGAELMAAGLIFIGYSEDLAQAGDRDITGTDAIIGGTTYKLYRRKHNPWANWQDAKPTDGSVPVPPPNRLPWTTNQPFTAFPSDFTQLPAVSIVVPNEQHDMHDGTVKMGDDWLAANLGTYAEWAKTHNSLLIVTWDEDSYSGSNRIPTIFYGANLRPGVNDTTWTLHNLLRTIEDMQGLATHAGSAAKVQPVSGVFAGELPTGKLVFRQGVTGYAGAHDTHVRVDLPNAAFGTLALLRADLDDNVAAGNQPVQPLVRFEDFVGAGVGQLAPEAPIISAKLMLTTGSTSGDESAGAVSLHRMLAAWDESSTWNSLLDGVTADGIEAAATPAFTLIPRVLSVPAMFDVTGDVRSWVAGTATNRGWALLNASVDGWVFLSSEAATTALRPALEITFAASVFEFSQPVYNIDEGNVTATITVTRTGWTGGVVTVQYATADGSAIAGADYTAASGALSWPADDVTPRTFTVPILADALVEADETVLLTLTNPTGAATLSAGGTATLTIKETAFNNWLVAHFGTDANSPDIAGENADPDGDGQSNKAEYLAGTDPRNASDTLRASITTNTPGQFHIRFTAQVGHAYTIQYKNLLTDVAWTTLTQIAAPPSAPQAVDFTDTTVGANTRRFYHVVTPQVP